MFKYRKKNELVCDYRRFTKSGIFSKKIANHCNCSQGAISQIKAKFSQDDVNSNKKVSFELGHKLISLHDAVVGKNVCS